MHNNTNTDWQRQVRGIALMFAIAFTIVACSASQTTAPPDGAPSGQGGQGELEQIVVTGAARPSTSDDESNSEASDRASENMRWNPRNTAEGDRRSRSVSRYSSLALARNTLVQSTQVRADDELWIIARPDPIEDPSTSENSPGSGAMLTSIPIDGDVREVPLPLKHTAVEATIDGYISTVDVKQQFHNPYGQKIEAVYLFPLPEKSAVNEFLMIIGERRIRGILREKEEAEAIYYEARRQGHNASLLLQHRPNVFEQKVANIEPGKSIDVEIRYFHTLAYRDGWYSFVFPTVVGPRFNPPGTSNPIEALPRGTQSAGTAVTYLRPDERSGHDISISVNIDAGVNIEALRSTHQIETSRPQPDVAAVRLAGGSAIPNRDFILEFQVAGKELRSNLRTWQDPKTQQGYFTVMLYPPASVERLPRRPMEIVFVIDTSGSMNGRPIEQAKDAVSAALSHLQPEDTFQIIRFSESASQLGPEPLPATSANINHARRHLSQLSGSGGTMMIEGIKAALDFKHDPARLRFVAFLTDGYIGNELEIIGAVNTRVRDARIFSFGVGSSVNRYLLDRMAKEGRGAVAYLGPQDSGSDIMSAFFKRVSHPAITDLQIDWGSMRVSDVYPAKLPDLFVGRPVVLTGKFSGTPSTVAVSGLAGNETRQFAITPRLGDSDNPNIAKVWARLRIADLNDRRAYEADPRQELAAAIKNTALSYQLMSDYTAFVAVDASFKTAGTEGTTVQQPVLMPEGVPYETTVKPQ